MSKNIHGVELTKEYFEAESTKRANEIIKKLYDLKDDYHILECDITDIIKLLNEYGVICFKAGQLS